MLRSLLFAAIATAVFVLGMALALVWRNVTSREEPPPLAAVSPVDPNAGAPVRERQPTRPAETPRPRLSQSPARPVAPAVPESNLPEPEIDARRVPQAARLAIVIDDLGHNLEGPQQLLAMGLPFTFSILPRRPHSAQVMRMARSAGVEFMVHLPMEPRGYPRADPGPGALMLAMDEAATRTSLSTQLASLPGAVGANNHMGSAYTADSAKMRVVQEVVAAHGLLFLNSRTTGSAVPGQIAERAGYRYLERDVFLDHDPAPASIRAQLARAAVRARQTGSAIAIGHPYPTTIRILREDLPAILRDGILLVPITQL